MFLLLRHCCFNSFSVNICSQVSSFGRSSTYTHIHTHAHTYTTSSFKTNFILWSDEYSSEASIIWNCYYVLFRDITEQFLFSKIFPLFSFIGHTFRAWTIFLKILLPSNNSSSACICWTTRVPSRTILSTAEEGSQLILSGFKRTLKPVNRNNIVLLVSS